MRVLGCLVLLAACSSRAPEPTPPPAEVTADQQAKAAGLVKQLKQSLVGAVTKAMQQGGAPAAIATCHTEAPALTRAASRDGAVIGRATKKPRNPKNLAAGWHLDALAQFEQVKAGGGSLDGQSFAKRLPDGRVAYAEPLVIQPLCVACHGAVLAPDVQAELAKSYPNDRAIGYSPGDLRGIAWVELPAQ